MGGGGRNVRISKKEWLRLFAEVGMLQGLRLQTYTEERKTNSQERKVASWLY